MNTGCQAEVLPDLSPAHALLSAAHQHPDRLSLIDAESARTFTLAQSASCVRTLAWYFTTLGLSAGDRIVVCAPNSVWHFLIHAAASWIHAVSVPISPLLPEAVRMRLYDEVAPALIIGPRSGRPHTSNLLASLSFEELDTLSREAGSQCPADFSPLPCHDETAALVFTSGTSGKMRAAQLTHANLWWASQCFRDGFEYCPGSAVCGVVAPLSHIGGFNGTSMDIFTHGGTLVVFASFDPLEVARGIEKWRISIMFAVPAMCHMLVQAAREATIDLSSWTRPLVGGDAMGASLFDEMSRMGLSPIHVWGMTELGGAGTFLSPERWPAHPGAIGFPFPYIQCRLRDAQGNLITEAGQAGIIEVRGPGVASRYWGEEERKNEWFSSSDIAVFDEDHCMHMIGRSSRVINTGGELVSPAHVEEALRALDCVADVCVVGLDDERWGQIVAAALVPATHEELSTENVRNLVKDSLAPWQHPRRIRWVEALPKTTTGKVDFSQAQSLFA